MSMPEHIEHIPSKIGNTLLQVRAVSTLKFDKQDRVLEMWEETGLHVRLTHIIGVCGEP